MTNIDIKGNQIAYAKESKETIQPGQTVDIYQIDNIISMSQVMGKQDILVPAMGGIEAIDPTQFGVTVGAWDCVVGIVVIPSGGIDVVKLFHSDGVRFTQQQLSDIQQARAAAIGSGLQSSIDRSRHLFPQNTLQLKPADYGINDPNKPASFSLGALRPDAKTIQLLVSTFQR